jgi:GNAT superfamily N-acetyltransferase
MASSAVDLVPPVRHASRVLVRELGFMRKTLAGTSLSAAAVHALIEIGDHTVHKPDVLRQVLMLTEKDFKEVVEELLFSGEIYSDSASGSSSPIYLTTKGQHTLAAINVFATEQVQKALEIAPANSGASIAHALQLYAEALKAHRNSSIPSKIQPISNIQVLPGYRPGILGRALEMHLKYYSKSHQFGLSFETELASGFGDLLKRLDKPVNEVWAAIEVDANGDEQILGTIFIDGEDLGGKATAHLRGFIVDDRAQGRGVGRRLLAEALDFVDFHGFGEVKLWTLDRLPAARHLYENNGFELLSDFERTQWGQFVRILEFSRPRPTSL